MQMRKHPCCQASRSARVRCEASPAQAMCADLPLAKQKPPGLDEPCNPSVTGSPGRSIPGSRSGQRDSLLRRMSSLFTSNKFPVWLEQGIGVQCTEMAAQIDTRRRQARQKKRNSLLISLLSGNPGIAVRSRLAALRLRTAAA